MKIINGLIQGSDEWHSHRAEHFNASDAPAMQGISPYKTRSDFLKEYVTGEVKEIDPATQARFDDGHRFEALARPLAENIIGEDLYPVTASLGKLSASFDGVTLDESIIFEHKTLNEKLKNITNAEDIPEYIRAQIDHQMIVSGADKCLFMASKWDDNDNLIDEVHCYYKSNDKAKDRIIKGWNQFEEDLKNYEHVDDEVKPLSEPQMDLPAVSIQVDGKIALIDNLDAFGDALKVYVDSINKKPETDQDFANLEASVKVLKKAEDALIASESNALAQAESIDTMRRKVAFNHEMARSNRLLIEKLVKSEKENRRNAILQDAKSKLSEHVEKLNARLGKPYMPVINADFVGAMKGKKTITSLQDAADTELANAKIQANEIADKIEININTLKEKASEHKFLFSDASQIIMKDNDDLTNIIIMRISEHKEAENRRLEAERESLQRKENEAREASERREHELKLAAEKSERERIEAEERAANAARETEERLKRESEAKAESERREQSKREADKQHVSAINDEIVQCFINEKITRAQANKVLALITGGFIKHVSINY